MRGDSPIVSPIWFWTKACLVVLIVIVVALALILLAPMLLIFVVLERALYWATTRAAVAIDPERGKRLHDWPAGADGAVVAGIGIVVAVPLVLTGLWLGKLYAWLAGWILGAAGMFAADGEAWKRSTKSAVDGIGGLFAWDIPPVPPVLVAVLVVLLATLAAFLLRIRGDAKRISMLER